MFFLLSVVSDFVLFTDSIEANVERSALNVERATDQLLQARNYQVCMQIAHSNNSHNDWLEQCSTSSLHFSNFDDYLKLT